MRSSVLWGQVMVMQSPHRQAQLSILGRRMLGRNLGRNLGRHLGTKPREASWKELANDKSPGTCGKCNSTDWGDAPAVSSGRCQMACGAVSARQNLVSGASAATSAIRKQPNSSRSEQGTRSEEQKD